MNSVTYDDWKCKTDHHAIKDEWQYVMVKVDVKRRKRRDAAMLAKQ